MRSLFDADPNELFEKLQKTFTIISSVELDPQITGRVLELAFNNSKESHSYSSGYRASSVGKPLMVQVLNKRFPSVTEIPVKNLMKITDGIITGAWVTTILQTLKFTVLSELEVTLGGITGHIDEVVFDEANKTIVILEVKSMSDNIFRKFSKAPSDDFGYVSQLSFYHAAVTECYPEYSVMSAFLMENRDTKAIKLLAVPDEVLTDHYLKLVERVKTCKCLELATFSEIYDTVPIPVPVNGQVPTAMKFSRWVDVCYQKIGGEYEVNSKDNFEEYLYNYGG